MRFFFSKPKTAPKHTEAIGNTQPAMYGLVHTLSETGPTRQHNEDHISACYLNTKKNRLLCTVADGMGGHKAGEVASEFACSAILNYVKHHSGAVSDEILRQALQYAHQQILENGAAHAERKGMGTTATTVFIHENRLSFAHIGDSRLYHYTQGNLTPLSKDHTLVQDMYEKGEITREEKDRHPMRNVLTQALGTTQLIQPQHASCPIALRDKFLLCSDGLYDVLRKEELEELMGMNHPAFILECMKTIAIARNASDNFSAILISFSDDFIPPAPITKEQTIPS